MKQLYTVTIEDYDENDLSRLIQKFSYTTRTPKKKWRFNIKATVRKAKEGDECNAHNSNILKMIKTNNNSFGAGYAFIKENMADGVIYGFWFSGIVFEVVKKGKDVFFYPTEKGVR